MGVSSNCTKVAKRDAKLFCVAMRVPMASSLGSEMGCQCDLAFCMQCTHKHNYISMTSNFEIDRKLLQYLEYFSIQVPSDCRNLTFIGYLLEIVDSLNILVSKVHNVTLVAATCKYHILFLLSGSRHCASHLHKIHLSSRNA